MTMSYSGRILLHLLNLNYCWSKLPNFSQAQTIFLSGYVLCVTVIYICHVEAQKSL